MDEVSSEDVRLHFGSGVLGGRTFVTPPETPESDRIDALLAFREQLLADGVPSPMSAASLAATCQELRVGGMVRTPRDVPDPADGQWCSPLPIPLPLPLDETNPPSQALAPWWSVIHPAASTENRHFHIQLASVSFEVERFDAPERSSLSPEDGQSPYFARYFEWTNRADADTARGLTRNAAIGITSDAIIVTCAYDVTRERLSGSSTALHLLSPTAGVAKDALAQFTRQKNTLEVGTRIPFESISAVSVRLNFASTKPMFGRKQRALFAERGYGSLMNVDVDIYWFDGWRQCAARVGTDQPWERGDERSWQTQVEGLLAALHQAGVLPSPPQLDRYDASWVSDSEQPTPRSISARVPSG